MAKNPKTRKKQPATPAPEPEPSKLTQTRGLCKKNAFLAAFRSSASVREAAKAVRIARSMHYRWLDEDPAYAAAFEKAREQAAQTLEDEAVRRAREGTLEPVFFQGEECGYVLRYSDVLLMFLLRGWRPDRYRERLEHSGPEGGPIELEIVDRLNAARKRLALVKPQTNVA